LTFFGILPFLMAIYMTGAACFRGFWEIGEDDFAEDPDQLRIYRSARPFAFWWRVIWNFAFLALIGTFFLYMGS
jgi:hypothetical protein